jgi:hypothetical protein
MSAVDRCERTDLMRTPPASRWITSWSAQNVMVIPARAGQPELPAVNDHVPRGGHHPVELDRSRRHQWQPRQRIRLRFGLSLGFAGSRGGDGHQGGREPQRQRLPFLLGEGGEPVGR